MTNFALHRHTPTLQVYSPFGLSVRSVAYYRRSPEDEPHPRVTATATRRAGRVSQHWDPRLFALSDPPSADTANLSGLTSLSGRPLLTDSVDAGWQLHLWGASGELQRAWDGRGTRTRQSYDALLRPVAVFEQRLDAPEHCIGVTTYGDQTPEALANNQCGQPVRVDDTAGCRQLHGYSLQGAPLAETRHFLQDLATPDWPQLVEQRDALLEPESATTRWHYDALGTLLQQTDARGNSQYTDYNVAGQPVGSRLQLSAQAEPTTVIRDLTYNAFGQLATETAGNGVTTTAIYRADTGALQRLVAQRADNNCVQDLRYSYDPVGNVLSITDASQSIRHFANARIEPVNTYAYDTLSQLIQATGREVSRRGHGPASRVCVDPAQLVHYTQHYTYDAAGNLHTLQHRGAQRYTRKMQVAECSNRSLLQKAGSPLPEVQAFSAGFDANGNVQQLQPGQVLQWDGRNQLCQVTPVVRDAGPDDTELYVYDGGGQRLRKVRLSQAKAVSHIAQVRYLPGLEIREDSATGETLDVITVQIPGRCSVRALHWGETAPDGISNDQLRYGVGDHLGSSTLELNSEACLVSQEGYYPYGGTAWWAARDNTEVKYKTIRYSGKERDATGLYYYGFRYYAPAWGRWINPDPAGGVDGLNLYQMVGNNPVKYLDPDGRCKVSDKYICANHMEPLAEASKAGNFAVSFRKAGAATLRALQEGAAAKGHNILGKTIKDSSLEAAYSERAPDILKKVQGAGIEGFVGSWDNTGLVGLVLSGAHELDAHVYPIDINNLDASLADLKAMDNWKTRPFTGDYDMHDLITFRSGKPRTMLANSKEEKDAIDKMNEYVAVADDNRRGRGNQFNTIRHGAQVNYPDQTKLFEREAYAEHGLVGDVARAGQFPLAMLDRGNWQIIENIGELASFYKSIGATMKNTWMPDGDRTYGNQPIVRQSQRKSDLR
ncbi:RHS repeat-associated core domain-containing protein [Pseudomonas sp. RT6P73]